MADRSEKIPYFHFGAALSLSTRSTSAFSRFGQGLIHVPTFTRCHSLNGDRAMRSQVSFGDTTLIRCVGKLLRSSASGQGWRSRRLTSGPQGQNPSQTSCLHKRFRFGKLWESRESDSLTIGIKVEFRLSKRRRPLRQKCRRAVRW